MEIKLQSTMTAPNCGTQERRNNADRRLSDIFTNVKSANMFLNQSKATAVFTVVMETVPCPPIQQNKKCC